MQEPSEGVSPVPDKPTESSSVIDMPWVLISNQIQQLGDSINQRFTDERVRMDDRFNAMERRMDDRFSQIDRRIDDFKTDVDKRFEQVDKRFEQIDKRFELIDRRFELMDGRLAFRMNIWVGIILAILSALLGLATGNRIF